MSKKRGKKTKKSAKKTHIDISKPLVYFGAIILILLLLAVVIAAFNDSPAYENDRPLFQINGEIVYESEFLKEQRISSTLGQGVSGQRLALQLLYRKALLQEAQRQGITLTISETERRLQERIEITGADKENFLESLAKHNIEYEFFLEQQREQFIIEDLASSNFEITVNPQEIEEFYEENKEVFGGESLSSVSRIIEDYLITRQSNEKIMLLGQDLLLAANISFYDSSLEPQSINLVG